MNIKKITAITLCVSLCICGLSGCGQVTEEELPIAETEDPAAVKANADVEANTDVKTNAVVDSNLKWWQDTLVYEAYPSSFRDTDGNGYGDIPGLTSKLDYLASFGIGAIWITPVFEDAPMGYVVKTDVDGITTILIHMNGEVAFEKYGIKLPQTGLLWWPVPLLICLGIIFIIIGILRRRSSEE